MRNRWEELWKNLNPSVMPQGVFEELTAAYSLEDRFYHNLEHIEDCLSLFEQTRFLASRPEEVELAIWFHDAVYDTTEGDNEQKSAEWAKAVINKTGLAIDVAERVFGLILATRHDAKVSDKDSKVLVDVDLSILGRDENVFRRYDENIRKEYSWVPEDIFKEKRAEILRGFLNRDYIFYNEEYRERFEQRARVNLRQAISRLEGNALD